MGDLSPFEFFKQETSHVDVVVRADAMSKLVLICGLMQPEKVRGDLVPYLQTKTGEPDQVLVQLGKRLGDIVQYIGGVEHAHILIPIFESLCAIEENVVRTNASLSVSKILAQFGPSNPNATAYLQLVKRLGGEEGGDAFYSRVAACLMIDECYRVLYVSSDKAVVQEIYFALCHDEMHIVKRYATKAFMKIVRHCDVSLQTGAFLQLLKAQLVPEEHSTVRVIAVENLASFCTLLKNETSKHEELAQMVKASAEDASWRVRLAIVKEYSAYATCFSPEIVTADIFPGLINLLQDTEAEVRIAACQAAVAYLPVCGAELLLAEVIPIAIQLAEDPMPNVRKVLAEMCVDIAAGVGSDAVAQHINDLVLKCLGDESPVVRLRVVSKLDQVASCVPALCTRMTPAIVATQKDPAWRVRKQWCLSLAPLVKHMGIPYFAENYLNLFLELFKDGVSDVRNAACEALPLLINASSVQYVYENIYPAVKALASGDYLLRLTMLEGLKYLLSVELTERFHGEVLALLLTCATDNVANIKLTTAKIFVQVCRDKKNEDGEINSSTLKPVLTELETDKDKDVKYFAGEALKHIA